MADWCFTCEMVVSYFDGDGCEYCNPYNDYYIPKRKGRKPSCYIDMQEVFEFPECGFGVNNKCLDCKHSNRCVAWSPPIDKENK